jgi:hypothetical protein
VRVSATERADAIRSGQVSSQEIVEAHLRRIEDVNPAVNAVPVVLGEQALEAAWAADCSAADGGELPPLRMVLAVSVLALPAVALPAERTWLSQNPACTGKYLNPDLPSSPASKYLGAPVQIVPARARAADPITYLAPGRPLPKFLICAGHARLHRALPGFCRVLSCPCQNGGPICGRADSRAGREPLQPAE